MRMFTGAARAIVLVLLPLLGGLSPTDVARADTAETEFRLKAIGVSPELRERVLAAVDDGAKCLRRIQNPDGDGHFTHDANLHNAPGLTALCGLAGRHAGTKEGRKVAEQCARWLAPGKGELRKDATGEVYDLSLSLMLLDAMGAAPASQQELASLLGESQSRTSGWWGYLTPRFVGRASAQALERELDEGANLSTTQFAGLALWSAHQRGVKVDRAVWTRHLEGILKAQGPTGSWAYEPGPVTDYREYPAGTFMGVASLTLSVAALGGTAEIPAALREKVAAAVKSGRSALERDGVAFLAALRSRSRLGDGLGDAEQASPYYELFALEKACILTGTERFGEIAWYAEGAELLIKSRNEDGGWGGYRDAAGARGSKGGWVPRSRAVDTAFALLFLVRATEAYGTTTPRPIDGGGVESVPVADPPAGK